MMKTTTLAIAATIAAGTLAHAQDAVQWRVEDGGNGHWYAVYQIPDSGPGGVCWGEALSSSRAVGGELVSLTSAIESEFVVQSLSTFEDCADYSYLGWIGLESASEWSSGEPVEWTNWSGSGPSGDGPHATMGFPGVNGVWNDIGGSDGCHYSGSCPLNRWIVEWSADCNGDGIVDYGQILDGTFEDANENGVPDCCEDGIGCDPCPGDVNFDGQVNGADISVTLGFWGLNGKPVAADINGDGIVNGADLAYVLGNWGPCP